MCEVRRGFRVREGAPQIRGVLFTLAGRLQRPAIPRNHKRASKQTSEAEPTQETQKAYNPLGRHNTYILA